MSAMLAPLRTTSASSSSIVNASSAAASASAAIAAAPEIWLVMRVRRAPNRSAAAPVNGTSTAIAAASQRTTFRSQAGEAVSSQTYQPSGTR